MCGISSKVGVQNLTLASRSLSQCHNKSAEPQPLPSVPARLLAARPLAPLCSPAVAVDSREAENWFSASFTWIG